MTADVFAPKPDQPPPVSEVGVLGWLRRNLFSTWVSAALTLGAAYLLWVILPPAFSWLIGEATFSWPPATAAGEQAASRADCAANAGACWLFARARLGQFFFGFYPEAERWRPVLTFVLFMVSLAVLAKPTPAGKRPAALFFFAIFPFLAFWLLHGGLGLPVVETSKWGGFLLTMVIGGVAIVLSLPIGILLALGRRSLLPVVKLLSLLTIEFVRGVPLITVLFMANLMLPLFLPRGVEIDILLRVLVGFTLFAAAYMAEVVRGGLQAIPKGQYEGAMSLGLGYWQMMRLIVLPQALRITIPGIVNTFIGLFKDTTLVSIVGLYDFLNIIKAGTRDQNWLGLEIEGYVFCALVYWLCCFGMSRYSIWLERRLRAGQRR